MCEILNMITTRKKANDIRMKIEELFKPECLGDITKLDKNDIDAIRDCIPYLYEYDIENGMVQIVIKVKSYSSLEYLRQSLNINLVNYVSELDKIVNENFNYKEKELKYYDEILKNM
jgi:hypothetical protein